MSSTVWWILAATIPVALIILFGAWIWMRVRLKKIKEQYAIQEAKQLEELGVDLGDNPALARENHGVLLWELKKQFPHALDDNLMEFLINTVWRNKYQRVWLYEYDQYIEQSLWELAHAEAINEAQEVDLIIVDGQKADINFVFDQVFKHYLKIGGLLCFINVPSRTKDAKTLLNHTRLIGVRREHQKIGKGIIIIAK